jgi:glycosyltransferase involved in cell wall biosynthesis
MVGNLNWQKGHEYALLALAAVIASGREATLRIAGDGPDRERIEHAIKDLRLTSCVELVGALPPAEVPALLRESDLFLQSSVSEGLSNSLIEAMASGLAVLATDVGGTAEAVTNGHDGVLVAARDTGALSRELQRLVDDPARRGQLGAQARATAEQRFAFAAWQRSFVDLYESMAA